MSMKHCGFVINKDNATAADVAELMRKVSEQVEEKFGEGWSGSKETGRVLR